MEDVVNVYSIYDRLLAHWSPPYFNHSTKEFLSGLAKAINDPESSLPLTLKPEHFSIWQIGQVDSGFITNIDRHLVAECTALVRTGVRGGGNGRTTEVQGPPGQSRRTAPQAQTAPNPNKPPITPAAHGSPSQGSQNHEGAR